MKKGIRKEVAALGVVLKAVNGLETAQQRWVFDAASTNLGLGTTSVTPSAPPRAGAPLASPRPGTDDGPGPKDFLRAKNPQSDVQRVACLAYYLSHYRGQPSFKTKDLTALNIEAAAGKIGNASQAVNNATKQSHYLAPAGGGRKQITAFGEDVVTGLPDQTAVKAVESNKPKRRKGGRRKAAAGKR